MISKNKKVSTRHEVRSTNVKSHLYSEVFCSSKSKRNFDLKLLRTFYFVLITALILSAFLANTGCNIYKFNEATVPDTIKTVKVQLFLNKARYVNIQLCPRLTDKLRQKIVGQTRLSQTNNDNADWEISGFITDYSLSTSAISGQREATNRLTVSVHVIKDSHKEDKKDEYDVSRSFEFSANQSLQQAEATLGDEMIRTLTDEIFNKLFSNW
jgi:Lipopolysaccharide-assembly